MHLDIHWVMVRGGNVEGNEVIKPGQNLHAGPRTGLSPLHWHSLCTMVPGQALMWHKGATTENAAFKFYILLLEWSKFMCSGSCVNLPEGSPSSMAVGSRKVLSSAGVA